MWKSIVLIIIFSIMDLNKLDLNASSLKLVQIVQRHGDRTPTNFYPNDPYKNESYWPDGIGELTRKGKTRMFEFGKTIRKKYSNYLGVSPREVSVRSSSASRTLESAQCFIAGLYRPSGFWVWSNDSNIDNIVFAEYWQPIAIDTVLAANDGLLRTTANCPNADKLWHEFMKSDEVRNYTSSKKEFIEKLSNKTGDEYWNVEPSPLRPLEFLSTTLRVERENGFQMSEWADNHTLNELRDLERHAFYFDWNSKAIQRLRAGLLLKELYNNMVNRVHENVGNNFKKLYLYETHDVNQVVLMQALNLYNQVDLTPPTYAASLVFELHQINEQFVVKLLYYNDVDITNTSIDNYIELKLIDCNHNSDCTLDKFNDSIQYLIPNDWNKECGLTNDSSKTAFDLFSLLYIFVGIAFGIFLGLVISVCTSIEKCGNSGEKIYLTVSGVKKYSE